MYKLLIIKRNNEDVFVCSEPWYVPRVGETIALTKWGIIYEVKSIFTTFSKDTTTEMVTVNVEMA